MASTSPAEAHWEDSMKITLLVFLFNCLALHAAAWSLTSQVDVSEQGAFRDTVTVYCRPDEHLCQDICQNQDSCWKEQELCFNCLGTSNPILRTVFTEVDRLFHNTLRILSTEESAKVFSARYIFISARSIYNFYSALDNEAVRSKFQTLCPNTTREPLIVVETNKNHEPSGIRYVICEGTGPYNQGMYVLEYSPHVETGPMTLNLNVKP